LSDGRETAFAKVNLCLFLGGPRSDGRHELVTLFESTEFADELIIGRLPSGEDEVVCPEVTGRNLVAGALGGILIPMVLERVRADPAVASGTFVTTITDVVGFFSFLGIATLWFGLK